MSGSIGDNIYRASGVIASAAAAGGLTLDSNFFITQWSTAFDTTSTATNGVLCTDATLTLAAQSGATNWLITYNEARDEQTWCNNAGVHMYGTDGSTAGTKLGECFIQYYDNPGASHSPAESRKTTEYYVSFTDGQTPIFQLNGRTWGGSNSFFINTTFPGPGSNIIAIKID